MRRMILVGLLTLALPTAALADAIANESFELQTGTPLTVGNFTGAGRACVGLTTISCSTGNYFNGQNINGGTSWVLNLVGPTGRILLDITSLTTSTGGNCALDGTNSVGTCNFSGTVTAFGTTIPNPSHMFEDSISGTLTRGPNASIPPGTSGALPWVLETLTGKLGNQSGVITDSNLSVLDVQICRSGQAAAGCGTPNTAGRLRNGHGAGTLDVDVEPTNVIPEPGTLALLGTGLIGLGGMARRKLKL